MFVSIHVFVLDQYSDSWCSILLWFCSIWHY